MKIVMSAIATTVTLLFAQSCSTSPNVQESSTAVSAQQHSDRHSTQAGSHAGHSMHDASDTKTNAAIHLVFFSVCFRVAS
ncbi:MAG: hypothetical protein IGS49_20995 [Chlorogloeopsis fritschii C42_A2020_084]|uniref:hypothetical protein n=1 Tax=Chlorogloeopsis fritschii TaxID=1124 RepID=UPI0019EF5938|nr:hypothetical protein [Chlorogloeopsis fritschii]MBF2007855.1 hypothetical protein [Chlorogloeopsis fritschii C42_A2020_084]